MSGLVQVCTCGYPVPDCWEDPRDGRHGCPGGSAGHVYPDRHRGLVLTCWWCSASHLLPHHSPEPLPLHRGHAAGPHHCHGHIFQVWPCPPSWTPFLGLLSFIGSPRRPALPYYMEPLLSCSVMSGAPEGL